MNSATKRNTPRIDGTRAKRVRSIQRRFFLKQASHFLVHRAIAHNSEYTYGRSHGDSADQTQPI